MELEEFWYPELGLHFSSSDGEASEDLEDSWPSD